MNYLSCKKIHDTFVLDEKWEPWLAVAGEKKVQVTDSLDKGYVYASLFFYDEVMREIGKIEKMIKKIQDEISMEVVIEDSSRMLMELSSRVRQAIGDDSLDAFIKEILAGDSPAITLMPTEGEREKLRTVKESIFIELFQAFVDKTFRNSKEAGELKIFKFEEKYIGVLSNRQKRLLAPALRLAGFIEQIRLDSFEILPDFTVRYKPVRLSEKFDVKEEEIKLSLKKMMETHSESEIH